MKSGAQKLAEKRRRELIMAGQDAKQSKLSFFTKVRDPQNSPLPFTAFSSFCESNVNNASNKVCVDLDEQAIAFGREGGDQPEQPILFGTEGGECGDQPEQPILFGTEEGECGDQPEQLISFGTEGDKCAEQPEQAMAFVIDNNDGVNCPLTAKTNCQKNSNSHCQSEMFLSMYDIGDYVGKQKISDEIRFALLTTEADLPENLCSVTVIKGLNNAKKVISFQRSWLQKFPWLSYSPTKAGGFCRWCVLFAVLKNNVQSFGTLVCTPFNGQKLSKALGKDGVLTTHMSLKFHIDASVMAEEFKKRYTNPHLRVDSQLCRQDVFDMNKTVLKSIAACVLLCGRQNISLRGHRDDQTNIQENSETDDVNRGNFLALLNFRAETDTLLREHLETASRNARYSSKTIQNDIIAAIAQYITDKILNPIVYQGQCFSVIADEVTDTYANKEVLAICLRYVAVIQGKPAIHERFLQFSELTRTTGEAIASEILNVLDYHHLPRSKLTGQAYDTTASMSSGTRGVQGRIRKECPLAVYCPCHSHLLNLSIASITNIREIRNIIDVMNEAFLFFDNSPKRQAFWEKTIKIEREDVDSNELAMTATKKLLGLCKTRWVERHDALVRLHSMYPYLFICLQAMTEPYLHPKLSSAEWNWDRETKIKAQGLLSALSNFQNMVAFIVLKNGLQPVNGLVKKLQKRSLDVYQAYTSIDAVRDDLMQLRNNVEDAFHEWYIEVRQLAEKIGVQENMPRTNARQAHRNNISAEEVEEYFRRSIAIPFLDQFSSEFQERFSESNRKPVSLLLLLLPTVLKSESWKIPPHADILTMYREILPNPEVFLAELQGWTRKWKNIDSDSISTLPDGFMEALECTDQDFYPNLHVLLSVGCTLPIGSCEAERSFSLFRRLKSFTRSTMSPGRLTGLALMAIHQDIKVDLDAVVELFIRKHPRRLFSSYLLDA